MSSCRCASASRGRAARKPSCFCRSMPMPCPKPLSAACRFIRCPNGPPTARPPFWPSRENKDDFVLGLKVPKQPPMIGAILLDLVRRETNNRSLMLARAIVTEAGREIRLLPKPHRSAGFTVLTAPDIPSALVESAACQTQTRKSCCRTLPTNTVSPRPWRARSTTIFPIPSGPEPPPQFTATRPRLAHLRERPRQRAVEVDRARGFQIDRHLEPGFACVDRREERRRNRSPNRKA